MQNQNDIKKQGDEATRNQIAFWKDLAGLLNTSDDNEKHFTSLRQSILSTTFLLSDSVGKVSELNPLSNVLSSFKKRGRLFRQAYQENRSTAYNTYHQMFIAFFQILLKKAVSGENVIKLYPDQIKHLWNSYRDMKSMSHPKNSLFNKILGDYWWEGLCYRRRIGDTDPQVGTPERKEILLYLPDAYPTDLAKTMLYVQEFCDKK